MGRHSCMCNLILTMGRHSCMCKLMLTMGRHSCMCKLMLTMGRHSCMCLAQHSLCLCAVSISLHEQFRNGGHELASQSHPTLTITHREQFSNGDHELASQPHTTLTSTFYPSAQWCFPLHAGCRISAMCLRQVCNVNYNGICFALCNTILLQI